MTSRCIRFGWLSILALNVLLSGMAVADDGASKLDTEIRKLLIERRDTLKDLCDAMETMYRDGVASIDRVFAAREDLLDAELQLATKKDERIKLLTQRVKMLRDLEAAVKSRFAAGVVSTEELLSTKARRLAAEIDLLRAQKK